MRARVDLAFLFIGGEHHVLHLAPVAAEMSRVRPDLSIHCICADTDIHAAIRRVGRDMDAPRLNVTLIPVPWIARAARSVMRRHKAIKIPLLAAMLPRLGNARGIVVPERTSAILRRMGWRKLLVHFRHGAGDRAPNSERRLKAFDLVVVPGEKDILRLVAQGLPRSKLRRAGYVKLDYLTRNAPEPPRLFDNDRPIVLYNPHFDPTISSLGIARDIIARFAAQDRYNLVYAPHIRAVEDLSADERSAWSAMAVPGKIIVDLGSHRLFDMSYTRSAHLYLGDLSSQLYEFLARPRPVAFIDAHGADWRRDPRYGGWLLGEVADGANTVIDAVDRAFARQGEQAERQRKAVDFAFGEYRGAIDRAAAILLDALAGPVRHRQDEIDD